MSRLMFLSVGLSAILGILVLGQLPPAPVHAEGLEPNRTQEAELQALALSLMMQDYGKLFESQGPMDPTYNFAPYWPVNEIGQLWQRAEERDWVPGEAMVLRRRSWLYAIRLPDGSMFMPTDLAEFTEAIPGGEEPPALDVPADVFRAQTLLRPVQAWAVRRPGEPMPPLPEMYEAMGLAANPAYLGELAGSFDSVQLLQFKDATWRRGIFICVGSRAWLWEIHQAPALLMGRLAIKLTTDQEAFRRAREGRQSWGTLEQLMQGAASSRLSWMERKHQVTLESHRVKLEQRAQLTLRALGSSQLAYQQQNRDQNYGSFEQMVATDYIQHGYTRRNIINYYSLAVFYAHPGKRVNGQLEVPSRFTIIALPQAPGLGLRTFSISEDQTVRVATDFHLNIVPNRGNEAPTGDDPRHWEPLR